MPKKCYLFLNLLPMMRETLAQYLENEPREWNDIVLFLARMGFIVNDLPLVSLTQPNQATEFTEIPLDLPSEKDPSHAIIMEELGRKDYLPLETLCELVVGRTNRECQLGVYLRENLGDLSGHILSYPNKDEWAL